MLELTGVQTFGLLVGIMSVMGLFGLVVAMAGNYYSKTVPPAEE